jgi:hypothetical protein
MRGAVHECVVLGIDPGETSGWSVWLRGAYVESGEARTPQRRAAAVIVAQRCAESAGVPLIIAAEKWLARGNKTWTPVQMMGTGAQWGRWAEQIDIAGIPSSRVVRVEPQVWRAATLGRRSLKRDAWKQLAIAYARGVVPRPVGADEAEAVFIGLWGTRAAEVGEALPKRRRKGAA